ncbi:MAG: hypothetical protein IKM65_07490 [Bacteroidaceae bacterium]|nr:hypothetical protein [Bacteroidaceae bacterium]
MKHSRTKRIITIHTLREPQSILNLIYSLTQRPPRQISLICRHYYNTTVVTIIFTMYDDALIAIFIHVGVIQLIHLFCLVKNYFIGRITAPQ